MTLDAAILDKDIPDIIKIDRSVIQGSNGCMI